tara:strand:+ start:254 stop:469 length:216 start_codon:yes stop_codon:yes gene_type:complete
MFVSPNITTAGPVLPSCITYVFAGSDKQKLIKKANIIVLIINSKLIYFLNGVFMKPPWFLMMGPENQAILF